MRILVTGGAGFIGSAVCRTLIGSSDHHVLNVDKLTYAGNLASVEPVSREPRYRFARQDICDAAAMARLFADFRPDAVMHLAAETHVDRSIDGPAAFVQTNVLGTCALLEAARDHWARLPEDGRARFRFLHVSTDEVYGSLGPEGHFHEDTPYDPSSPYSASKAGSDHLVVAWHRTFGLPTLVSNCSNNYGPYHFPEKLIPLMITNALTGGELPIYGEGANIRDWLYVEDHARALIALVERGRPGRRYNIGGRAERTNREVVLAICDILDGMRPLPGRGSYRERIAHVRDRPGHDFRYAIDPSRIEAEIGWRAQETFESGLRKTVAWYLDNEDWWRPLKARKDAAQRLGLGENTA